MASGKPSDGRPSPESTVGAEWPAWNETDGYGLVIGDNADYTAPVVSAVSGLRKAKCDFFDRVFFKAAAGHGAAQHHANLSLND